MEHPQFSFHAVFSVISKGTITYYGEPASANMKVLEDLVHPGDIIIFGKVDSQRAVYLDKIVEINQKLGCKWEECKKRLNRKIQQTDLER